MTSYKSKLFSQACSLPLKVQFFIKNGQIHQTLLVLHSKKEIQWEILGDQLDTKLELLINSWMQSYMANEQPVKKLPISLDAMPPYSLRVLKKLETIPFGDVLAYKDLAIATGNPRGARAVGNACGRNPVPLIIPCHRVLASQGRLGGFSAGIEIKKELLAFENHQF
jgi:methylated-DNA-[protein]-cysteine S-methyltransferase